jgi:segregation and condensation protein B
LQTADIDRYIEALLFVSEGPVSLEDLARALQVGRDEAERSVERLLRASAGRGTHIVYAGERVQMVTAPDAAPYVEQFLGLDLSAKLSSAALETLAIIAYRQPITRAQIDAIRGVNSDGVIRSLIAKSLVAPVGRLEQVGRPIVLGTTLEFLQYFGVRSLADLPSLPELANLSDSMAALGTTAVEAGSNGHAAGNGSKEGD